MVRLVTAEGPCAPDIRARPLVTALIHSDWLSESPAVLLHLALFHFPGIFHVTLVLTLAAGLGIGNLYFLEVQ